MSRIADAFANAKIESSAHRRALLIPFVTAGFPTLESTAPLLTALADGGADIIELGIPFSDPAADGIAIQRASEIALKNGATLKFALSEIRRFRKNGGTTPLVTMGYANSFLAFGISQFARQAQEAGVDGAIVVDLPAESSAEWREDFSAAGLDLILLVSPTTTPSRMKLIAQAASGYLYYVSLKGVTGANNLDADSVRAQISALAEISDLPIAVGFGVRDSARAKTLGKMADAVVVGSRLIELIEESPPSEWANAARQFTAKLRSAMQS